MKKFRFFVISAVPVLLLLDVFLPGVFSRSVFADAMFVPDPVDIIVSLLPVLAVVGLVVLCAAVGIILVRKKQLEAQEEKRKNRQLQQQIRQEKEADPAGELRQDNIQQKEETESAGELQQERIEQEEQTDLPEKETPPSDDDGQDRREP